MPRPCTSTPRSSPVETSPKSAAIWRVWRLSFSWRNSCACSLSAVLKNQPAVHMLVDQYMHCCLLWSIFCSLCCFQIKISCCFFSIGAVLIILSDFHMLLSNCIYLIALYVKYSYLFSLLLLRHCITRAAVAPCCAVVLGTSTLCAVWIVSLHAYGVSTCVHICMTMMSFCSESPVAAPVTEQNSHRFGRTVQPI